MAQTRQDVITSRVNTPVITMQQAATQGTERVANSIGITEITLIERFRGLIAMVVFLVVVFLLIKYA